MQTRIEIRTCVKCGETKEILQKFKHATNVCSDCSRKQQREHQRLEAIREGRRVGVTGRTPYPFPHGHTTIGNYFKGLASKTFRCQTKKEWRELMKIRLDTALENDELMKWINSHDGDEPKEKRQKRIETDYPDTRYMTWEEYEKGLGDNEVDS